MILQMVILGCLLIGVSVQGSGRGDSPEAPEGNGPFGAQTEAEKTIVGCILQRNERFLLMNKKRPQGPEIRMAADLNEAIGLQAKVKGVFEYTPSPIQSASLNGGIPKRVPIAMEVTSVTFMSGKCDENGMVRKYTLGSPRRTTGNCIWLILPTCSAV